MTSEPTKVLVVDDRPASRYPVVHALTRAGFAVTEASTGREALELAIGLPAVILLDVKLPDILGYEVCRRLKSNPQTQHIPILQLSSAFLDNESRVYALDSGADGYLTQPVEPSVLIATVKSLVRLNQAESQSRLSSRQWQATFDALSEGVAVVGPDGIIQRCNRAMTVLLNQSYASIEGQPLLSLLSLNFGLHLHPSQQFQQREIQSGGRYFHSNHAPIVLESQNTGSIFILSETTEQKRAEGALLISERLAATGRVANTIAHEINNPLEAITNLLYLIEHSLDRPESAREYVVSAQQELTRVSRIARQILTFNRESSTPGPVSVSELLGDVLALNNRALIQKKLTVEREWDNTINVEGFSAQLRQVFSNLVRNAIEASYPGKFLRIRVSKCRFHINSGRPAARITIADQGSGIEPQNLRRVFDAFFTTKELRGSGIGLWLSSTIVQEHHGRIQVRSSIKPGASGTCISVILPCQRSS